MPNLLPTERYHELAAIDGTGKLWRQLMLDCLTDQKRIDVPGIPYALNGVRPQDIEKILEKNKPDWDLAPDDVRVIHAWRQWRDPVIDAEARNTNTLHGLLLLASVLEGEQRYRVEQHARNHFGADVTELLNVDENLYGACRDWCRDLGNCSVRWREPRWDGGKK